VADPASSPPRPWYPIQGTRDASPCGTPCCAGQERDVFIGTLVLRHTDHHASLLQRGWQEVPVAEIGVSGAVS
jgi:hypothetical protein